MTKPKVFFSHSSADKEYLAALKNFLSRKTKSTLEIFLSSDGQSIPFGHNWVHSVETALQDTSVMFVAVSPESLRSGWLYFEAGYSYSRKVKVIPIGILGLSIGDVPPPLGLLQGFDIVNEAGLNNLLAVINREYGYQFEEDFNATDFAELSTVVPNYSSSRFPHIRLVDRIESELPIRVSGGETTSSLKSSYLSELVARIEAVGVQYHKTANGTAYLLSGARIDTTTSLIKIHIDLLSFERLTPLIRGLFASLYEPPVEKWWFRTFFQPELALLTADFKVSSRLAQVGIPLSSVAGNLFQFQNAFFALDASGRGGAKGLPREESSLRVVSPLSQEEPIPLSEIIDLLWEVGIIYKRSETGSAPI